MTDSKVIISINDLISVVSLIDIVSSRGAFKGQELTTIGTLRDKLALFIEENKVKEDTKSKTSAPVNSTPDYESD